MQHYIPINITLNCILFIVLVCVWCVCLSVGLWEVRGQFLGQFSPCVVRSKYWAQVVSHVQQELLSSKPSCWPYFQVYLIIFFLPPTDLTSHLDFFTHKLKIINLEKKSREIELCSSLNCSRKLWRNITHFVVSHHDIDFKSSDAWGRVIEMNTGDQLLGINTES